MLKLQSAPPHLAPRCKDSSFSAASHAVFLHWKVLSTSKCWAFNNLISQTLSFILNMMYKKSFVPHTRLLWVVPPFFFQRVTRGSWSLQSTSQVALHSTKTSSLSQCNYMDFAMISKCVIAVVCVILVNSRLGKSILKWVRPVVWIRQPQRGACHWKAKASVLNHFFNHF